MSPISDDLRFMARFMILEVFSCWDNKKGHLQFLLTFLAVSFMVYKLEKSGLYIITYFEHRQCFIRRFLVFSFLVFRVFKYLKFTFSNNFSWFADVKVLVCKLYMQDLQIILLFWTCPTFWTIFIFDCC